MIKNIYAFWLATRARKGMLFTKRRRFDLALRPETKSVDRVLPIGGLTPRMVISYPDAIYHITPSDVRRAVKEANKGPSDGDVSG